MLLLFVLLSLEKMTGTPIPQLEDGPGRSEGMKELFIFDPRLLSKAKGSGGVKNIVRES